MQVQLRRRDRPMTEKELNLANVHALLQQVGGEAMTKDVRREPPARRLNSHLCATIQKDVTHCPPGQRPAPQKPPPSISRTSHSEPHSEHARDRTVQRQADVLA